jgi:hypothetical protein
VTAVRFTPARAVAAALVAAAAIQFVPVGRDNPPVSFEVDAPAEVRGILERACYDCHSNLTRWPWYSRVAPASWLVARDVRRGRDDVNFSEWPAFDFEEQEQALADIAKQLDRGRMPPRMYVMVHREARLTEDERRILLEWARGH